MSRKPTWAAIRRRIGKGTGLTVVTQPSLWVAPTEGFFHVRRVVAHGLYLTQHHGIGKDTQCFVRWSPASDVVVHSLDEWIVWSGAIKQAWAILPDVPF